MLEMTDEEREEERERAEYRSSKEHADTLEAVERAAKILRGVPVVKVLRSMGGTRTVRDRYRVEMLQNAVNLSISYEYKAWLERWNLNDDEKPTRKEPGPSG